MAAMSGYTIANLKEVEDQAPKFGLSPDLEARFARVALDAEMIGITYQRLAPNTEVSSCRRSVGVIGRGWA